MNQVLHIVGRPAGATVRMRAHSIIPLPVATITPEHQASVENALSMALYFIRQSHATPANLWAATVRTNRALTLLKQASEIARAATGRA